MSPIPPLAERLREQALSVLAQLAESSLPGLALPRWFAGHPVGDDTRADLAWTLVGLAKLGSRTVAGRPIEALLGEALAGIQSRASLPFAAYRTAESLAAFGPFAGNPILAGLDPEARERVASLTDTSGILDRAKGTLGRRPRNYWFVLLRAENARAAVGLPVDPEAGRLALERCREILASAEGGFLDDDLTGAGRYDLYSADMLLFAEPLAEQLGRDSWRRAIAFHAGWLGRSFLLDGSAAAWGRSTGPLSVLLSLELAALALREGVGPAGTMLAIVDHVAGKVPGLFTGGLSNAHQGRRQDAYRGPARRLQLTFDLLGKLVTAARWLGELTPERLGRVPEKPARIDIDRDEWTSFDAAGAGLWTFRGRWWAFQLPAVAATRSDYAPFPCAPGELEPPADSPMRPGVPRVIVDGREHSVATRPVATRRIPSGLALRYDSLVPTEASDGGSPAIPPSPGEIIYRVDDRDLVAEHRWTLPAGCNAVTWGFTATGRRYRVLLDKAPAGTVQRAIPVDGIAEHAGRWSAGTVQHEIEAPVPSSRRVELRLRVRPVQRVLVVPAPHQYVRSLYEALPPDLIEEISLEQGRPFDDPAFEAGLLRADVLHLHWPEYLIGGGGLEPAEFQARMLALIRRIGDSPIKVIWTLHNRRPHYQGDTPWTTTLWRAWAEVADAVIHHSRSGERLMRGELPFRPDAIHRVIPHGHFGLLDATCPTRSQAEKALGLVPCRVRLGVVGRPQKEKRVESIARAFVAGAPRDWQLLVAAMEEHTILPDDPRIIRLPRKSNLPRAEIARQVAACDALVAVVGGPTYLTSGQHADAVGHGIPMIVDRWPFWKETLGQAAIVFGNTEDDLAATLRTLSPEAIAEAGKASKALQDPLGWPTLAKPFAEVLDELGIARRL